MRCPKRRRRSIWRSVSTVSPLDPMTLMVTLADIRLNAGL